MKNPLAAYIKKSLAYNRVPSKYQDLSEAEATAAALGTILSGGSIILCAIVSAMLGGV